MNLKYQAHDAQEAFHLSKARFRLFLAGIGAGKTHAGAYEVFRYATGRPGSRGYIYGRDYPMIKVCILKVKEIIPHELYTWKEQQKEMHFVNGTVVEFKSLDDPESIRGIEPDWGWVDEGAVIKREAWKLLFTRHTRTKVAPLWITTTPKGKANWVYDDFYTYYAQGDPDYGFVRCRSEDSPHVSKDLVAKAKAKLSAAFFKQEYEASFETHAGIVYQEFDRAIHVKAFDEDKLKTKMICRSIDWGYTNPFASLRIYVMPNNHIYITGERYIRNVINAGHAVALKKMDEGKRINFTYCDPSSAEGIAVFAEHGINCSSKKSSVAHGIEIVRSFLKNAKITIHPSCVNLIREFEVYRYKEVKDKDKDANVAEEPLKENDHQTDSLRYFFVNHFPNWLQPKKIPKKAPTMHDQIMKQIKGNVTVTY